MPIVRRLWALYLARPGLVVLGAGVLVLFAVAGGLALAAVLLRARNERRRRRWERLERRWEEPVLAVVAGVARPGSFWRLVARTDRLDCVNFLLRFTRRLAGAERRIIEDLAAPYLDLVAARLGHREPERRARAVQTLSLLGRRRYARALVRALDDPSPLVAMVAARALARRESPDFAAAILDRLHRFETWRPSFLASMLASVGPALAPALMAALADRDRNPRARCVAADALRELHDPAAADVAARVLDDARDRDLQAAVLALLADVGRDEHLPVIRRYLASPEAIVRARAASALGHIGAPEDTESLAGALNDPSPWVALRAAEALRESGAEDALARIVAAGGPRAELAGAVLVAGEA